MKSLFLATYIEELQLAYSAKTTASSITAPAPTTTQPSGNGIVDMAITPGKIFNSCGFAFYGAGSADQTFTGAITGWKKSGSLWIPIPMLTFSGLLGTATGVASQNVINTDLFADTLTISTAYTNVYEVLSPGNNTVAFLKMLDTFGCDLLQLQLAVGTATSVGGLFSQF